MIRRKPDSENKFTADQKITPPIFISQPPVHAVLALVFVLLMLVTPGPMIDAIKNLLSLPVMPPSESGFPMDKVVHCLMFAGCTLLGLRAWAGQFRLLWMVLLLLCFAALTEFLQTLVPGRSGDAADFFADAVGVLMGVWWFKRRP